MPRRDQAFLIDFLLDNNHRTPNQDQQVDSSALRLHAATAPWVGRPDAQSRRSDGWRGAARTRQQSPISGQSQGRGCVLRSILTTSKNHRLRDVGPFTAGRTPVDFAVPARRRATLIPRHQYRRAVVGVPGATGNTEDGANRSGLSNDRGCVQGLKSFPGLAGSVGSRANCRLRR